MDIFKRTFNKNKANIYPSQLIKLRNEWILWRDSQSFEIILNQFFKSHYQLKKRDKYHSESSFKSFKIIFKKFG